MSSHGNNCRIFHSWTSAKRYGLQLEDKKRALWAVWSTGPPAMQCCPTQTQSASEYPLKVNLSSSAEGGESCLFVGLEVRFQLALIGVTIGLHNFRLFSAFQLSSYI